MSREPFAGTGVDASDVLLVGLGTTAVCYYRVLLPAHAMGCDYVGVLGDPSAMAYATGLVRRESRLPRFTDYRVVILQQPSGEHWLGLIEQLRDRGIKVLYEIDDYLHGVAAHRDHDYRDAFAPAKLVAYEECMRACDGLLVSTDRLAELYRPFNKNVWVARNGIDPRRYSYTKPAHEGVTIGWAGATGHRDSALPWLQATARVMAARPHVNFLSIGQPFARGFQETFGQERGLAIPFLQIEQYPAALAMVDIAIAPGGDSDFQRCKSDLRWMEASLSRAATVAHAGIYDDISHGETGLQAHDPVDAERFILKLVDKPEMRKTMANAAHRDVLTRRTIEQARKGWERAIVEVLDA